MRTVLFHLIIAYLGYHGKPASADIWEIIGKARITMAGFANVPQCEYESCYNSDQCGLTPARMNPNYTHNTNAKSPCSCDSSCLLYGDCCFDYFETCLGFNISDIVVNKTLNVNTLVDHFGSEAAVLRQKKMLIMKECLSVKTGSKESQYWLVSQCPHTTAKGNISCTMNDSLISQIPVTLIENPTITFSNYHCAECHGLQRRHVRFWNTTATCQNVNITTLSFEKVREYINQGACSLVLQLNSEDKPRSCMSGHLEPSMEYPSLPSLMKPSQTTNYVFLNKFSKLLCSLYLYPVKDPQDGFYRNPHCAHAVRGPTVHYVPLRCSGWWDEIIPGSISIGFTPLPGATPYPGTGFVYSFSMLFNFGENKLSLDISGRVLRSETRLCLREDEVFNIYSHKCVTLLCDGMDMRPVNGTCLLKDKQVVNGTGQLYPKGAHRFTVILSVQGKKTLMKTFVRKKLKSYLEQFLSDRNPTGRNVSISYTYLMRSRVHSDVVTNDISVNRLATYIYQATVKSNAPVSTLINSTGCLFREISLKLNHHNVTVFDFYLNDFKKTNSSVTHTISEYYEYVSNSTEICPVEHVSKVFQDVELITVQGSYYARLNRTYFRLDNIGFEMRYEDSGAVPNVTDIIVCVPDFGNQSLHCPNGTLSIHTSEFSLLNGSLRYISSGVVLLAGNSSLTRHGAVICSHFSRSHTDQVVFFDYNNVQVVLTIVTSSVSVASLVGVLLVYSLLPQLRNVPGKVVMSLSATLLVAQGLQLMTKVPTGQMCVAVASLAHVLWLSSFLWMSLLSLDLARSLRSMSPVSGIQTHNKLFCLYACVGWGIPIILVVTCVVIDHFHVWGISIGYGSDHVCWIANPKASLYVFGLPMALTLAINVTCFILTLISIERTASEISSHSKRCKNEKTRLGIYVRLSFIMGFSWIFSFVAAFAHVNVLWYFQIVLNGLQGFYIFVCFVCKSRILQLLMDKLYSVHKKAQRQDRTSTTTTSTNAINIKSGYVKQ